MIFADHADDGREGPKGRRTAPPGVSPMEAAAEDAPGVRARHITGKWHR